MKALIVSFFLIALISCNNKTEEKLYSQQQLDSIMAEEKAKEKIRFQAIQDSINNQKAIEEEILELRSQLEGVERRMSIEIASLEVEKDRLIRIKEPQFLRTSAEREEQISKQSHIIQNIEKTIKSCNIRLDKVKSQLKEIDPSYSDADIIITAPGPEVEFN